MELRTIYRLKKILISQILISENSDKADDNTDAKQTTTFDNGGLPTIVDYDLVVL